MNSRIQSGKYYPDRWRPSLTMIVVSMLIFVLTLPLGGVWLFRFYDSQLVRETENELIAQGAFIKAIMRLELEKSEVNPSMFPQSVPAPSSKYRSLKLVEAELDLSTSPILPRRKNAQAATGQTNTDIAAIGRRLGLITAEVQKTTLAGFRVVDHRGTVITGKAELGQSLGHILEVQEALKGRYSSVIRERVSDNPRPPIYSISRGTDIRVFVAMPVEFEGRVAGAVYLSRTPSHFLRELYGQRWKVAGAALFLLMVTLAIALIFVRTIKDPIDALNKRAQRISAGDRTAIAPLSRHGTKEIAELSDGLLSMSEKLQDRSDYLRTFANHVSHELKSPLTSIQGAAELLKDSDGVMDDGKRKKFLNNILADTDRMTTLLTRLRELAATETPEPGGISTVLPPIEASRRKNPGLDIKWNDLPEIHVEISSENLGIIFDNLFDNSAVHGATEVVISTVVRNGNIELTISDNGSGISQANREKVFDPFFTTRRDHGGTGMGLSIVSSILTTHSGSIRLAESEQGTKFVLTLPLSA